MFTYLERLRKKPLAVRRRIAFLAAVFVTVCIVAVWLSLQSFNVTSPIDSAELQDELKPLGALKENAVSFYQTVKELGQSLFVSSGTTSP